MFVTVNQSYAAPIQFMSFILFVICIILFKSILNVKNYTESWLLIPAITSNLKKIQLLLGDPKAGRITLAFLFAFLFTPVLLDFLYFVLKRLKIEFLNPILNYYYWMKYYFNFKIHETD